METIEQINKQDSEDKPKEKLSEMVERLENANRKAEEILARQEEIAAKNLLGGQTAAGNQEPTKPQEKSPKEYTREIEQKIAKGEFNTASEIAD
jgi:hypothetical protein